jgi:hypothetical protein
MAVIEVRLFVKANFLYVTLILFTMYLHSVFMLVHIANFELKYFTLNKYNTTDIARHNLLPRLSLG